MFDRAARQAIEDAARRYELDPVALLALAWKESSGSYAWNVDGVIRPPIRFEGHIFYDKLPIEKRPRAIKAALASTRPGAIRNPKSYAARYALLDRAIAIDEFAAFSATSWGIGQVLGLNAQHLGYESPQALALACQTLEGQVEAMCLYIKHNAMAEPLNKHEWEKAARIYNGPGYKRAGYHTELAKLYDRFAAKPAAADVELLQKKLAKAGYGPGKIDGFVGPKTKGAVERFQADAGLVVDGKAGPMTIEALDDAIEVKTEVKQVQVEAGTVGGAAGITIGSVLAWLMANAQEIAPHLPAAKAVFDELPSELVVPLVVIILWKVVEKYGPALVRKVRAG